MFPQTVGKAPFLKMTPNLVSENKVIVYIEKEKETKVDISGIFCDFLILFYRIIGKNAFWDSFKPYCITSSVRGKQSH